MKINSEKVIYIVLIIIAIVIAMYFYASDSYERTFMIPIAFVLGMIGGITSIIERSNRFSKEEKESFYAKSLTIKYLLPSFIGGIFAIILMLLFVSGIIEGHLFPRYPAPDAFQIKSAESFYYWITHNYPLTGQDVAKLWVWSFIAGFNERLVIQVLRSIGKRISDK